MRARLTRMERRERLRQVLLREPERQPPSGWWQDAKGSMHPPGTYVPLPPRTPRGLRAALEAHRHRRYGE
jgi:hypothetical protein